MTTTASIVADLRAECDELDALVADLPSVAWAAPTPAPGWTIAHQMGHLLWTDRAALIAINDEQRLAQMMNEAVADPPGYATKGAEEFAIMEPARLLAMWRLIRAQLQESLLAVPVGHKLAWFGPPMSAPSMASARLMETWAHGLDIADTLGVHRRATRRLKSVAHLGVRARDYAFHVNNIDAPKGDFFVELRGPDRDTWTWGPAEAEQRVTGSGEDFCLLVTQRRPRNLLDLTAHGRDAQRWLQIAQAFAGPPGEGR